MATVIAAALPERLAARDAGGTADVAIDARLGRVWSLAAGNALLSLATLGVYSFWGRARVRRYLWESTRFRGEPFEYSGTGGELFRGALIVFWLVILPAYASAMVLDHLVLGYPLDAQGTPGSRILSVLILFLLGLGRFRAVRYRLSRTSWRGIRGGLEGQGWAYAGTAFGHTLLLVLTLGLSKPLRDVALARLLYGAMRLGDRPVRLEAESRPLYGRYLVCWLLAVPTLGLSLFWYVAARERYVASCMRWEGLRFAFDANGAEIMRLVLGNLLLLIATLGIARPVTGLRTFRFVGQHLRVSGEADFAEVHQSQLARPARGEGLASFLDVDGLLA